MIEAKAAKTNKEKASILEATPKAATASLPKEAIRKVIIAKDKGAAKLVPAAGKPTWIIARQDCKTALAFGREKRSSLSR